MHVYMLVYLYLQFSLDFYLYLHVERKTYSVRLFEEQKGRNPTHHRPIEEVSSICTVKYFSFLDRLLNIKHNLSEGCGKICEKEQRK